MGISSKIRSWMGYKTIANVRIDTLIDAKATDKLFKNLKKINKDTTVALAVSMNSRGGSPTQSMIISNKLKVFTKKNNIPLFMFTEDYAASGGYYILCIGDKIYTNRNSLIGSIGVISSQMNIKTVPERLHLERRVVVTNEKLLQERYDVFKDEDEEAINFTYELLGSIHSNFIEHVEENRGKSIKPEGEERKKIVYNADVFTGDEAIRLGLADEIGNLEEVMKKEYPKAKIINYSKENRFDRLKNRFSSIFEMCTYWETISKNPNLQILKQIMNKSNI